MGLFKILGRYIIYSPKKKNNLFRQKLWLNQANIDDDECGA